MSSSQKLEMITAECKRVLLAACYIIYMYGEACWSSRYSFFFRQSVQISPTNEGRRYFSDVYFSDCKIWYIWYIEIYAEALTILITHPVLQHISM